MFTAGLLTTLLLAASAMAAPKGNLASRVARRSAVPHHSRTCDWSYLKGNISNVAYSTNWAGAVYAKSPGTYKSITGTFSVPTLKGSSGEGPYGAAAWVGIDGDTCGTAILQTGVDFIQYNGEVSYHAWYEWYPWEASDFDSMEISAGDTIRATVIAFSTTEGTAIIENLTTGDVVSTPIQSSYALCEQNAEWIVEDFKENGTTIAFADFGTVTFTDAEAFTSYGPQGPSGAIVVDILQNGQLLTSSSVDSSSLTVSYV